MSYDLRFAIKADIAGEERYICIGEPEYDNPTYNLGKMFRACTGWDFKQGEYYRCSDVIHLIQHGENELTHYASKYKKYEPENGWGDTQGALKVLKGLREDMCRLSEERDIPLEYLYVAW